MSRFNNLRAFSAVAEPRTVALEMAGPAAVSAELPAVAYTPAEEIPNSTQRFGFFLVCTYLLSASANDLSMRFFHRSTYISLVAEILLPIVLFCSGAAFRALRLSPGRYWVFFLAWMFLDAPFSVWRTGTLDLLFNYGLKSWPVLFYIASFAITIATLRRFLYVQVVSAVIVLISCYIFGQESSDGRFDIGGSIFFDNPNELAMQILFGIAALLFIVLRGSATSRVLALGAIGVSMIYVLRTASRGALLGSIVLFIATALISRYKVPILAFGVLIAVLAGVLIPDQTLGRLKLLFSQSTIYDARNDAELSAIASRLQREQLLRRSVIVALTHPLFGIGPGQFAVEESGEAAKKGVWANWLGTHNGYTQVASECGLPAFFAYMAVFVFCFRTSYRVMRTTSRDTAQADLHALSFCLVASMIVYAICTFFDHIAYSGMLPILGGMSISLKLAAERQGVLPAA